MSNLLKHAFAFQTNPTLEQYRDSWRQSLQQAKSRLADLERPRTGEQLCNYLRELDTFHLGSSFDTDAAIWADLHPDQSFRDEAKIASDAATDLDSKALASSALAANLSSFEKAKFALDKDSLKFLKVWKKDLVRGGAYLELEAKSKLLRLNREIEDCKQMFHDNIRNDRRTLQLDAKDLPGVPDDYLAARSVDSSTNKISVAAKEADIGPIRGYCQLQATREKAARLTLTTASPINEQVLKRLLILRNERAKLLAHSNAAEYELLDSMAGNVDQVTKFLDDIHNMIAPIAEGEKEAISLLLRDEDGIDFKPWDITYGINRLKSHLLSGFNPKEARQYFQVDKVFPALLQIAQTLFSLRFEPIEDTEVWHPSVTAAFVYDIADGSNTLIGRIFFDIYPREGKLDGAAAYRARRPVKGEQLGEVILYANMPAQAGACMSYREVQTILHELGHCAHMLVSAQSYHRFSGIDFVPMDFIEAPSQMLELWLTDPGLCDFAVNAQGARIPDTLLQQLIASDAIGRCITIRSRLAAAKYCVSTGWRAMPGCNGPLTASLHSAGASRLRSAHNHRDY